MTKKSVIKLSAKPKMTVIDLKAEKIQRVLAEVDRIIATTADFVMSERDREHLTEMLAEL